MNLYETQNKKWCHVNLLSSVGPDHTNDTRRKILASNVFKISETHQLFSLTQKMVKKKYSGNYDFYAVLCNNLEWALLYILLQRSQTVLLGYFFL